MAVGAPSVYDGLLACGVVGARAGRQASRGVAHTDEGEQFDDFIIRQEWWTGGALQARWCAGNDRGAKIEVVGLSRKVEEIFWDAFDPGQGWRAS
jgi:hypothetical protein